MRGLSSEPVSPVRGASLDAYAPVRGVSLEVGTSARAAALMSGASVGRSSAVGALGGVINATGVAVARSTSIGALSTYVDGAGAAVGRSSATANVLEAMLYPLGSDLLHHWEVPPQGSAFLTLNSGNISQLNDRAAAGKHLAQGTAINQPAYFATGGANNQPYLQSQDTARYLINSALSIEDGTRIGIYAVYALVGGSASRVPWQLLNTAVTQSIATYFQTTSSAQALVRTSGGGLQFNALSVPSLTSNWVRGSIEFFASGLTGRINGSAITPAFTGSLGPAAIGAARIGSPTESGCKFACLIVVTNPDTTKRGIVESYIAARYGL